MGCLAGWAWGAGDKAESSSLEDLEHSAPEMGLHDERLLKVSEEGMEVRSEVLKGSCRCMCAGRTAEVRQSANWQVDPVWESGTVRGGLGIVASGVKRRRYI